MLSRCRSGASDHGPVRLEIRGDRRGNFHTSVNPTPDGPTRIACRLRVLQRYPVRGSGTPPTAPIRSKWAAARFFFVPVRTTKDLPIIPSSERSFHVAGIRLFAGHLVRLSRRIYTPIRCAPVDGAPNKTDRCDDQVEEQAENDRRRDTPDENADSHP